MSFQNIRSWRGSQDQAFEELCFQLRDPTPSGAELIKAGSPDGGLEWYVKHRNGVEWGWQAKYAFDIDTLLKLMEESLKTVVRKRPGCRRMTFCIPFDLSDRLDGKQRKAARQKFEDRKTSWRSRIKGAERIRIDLWQGGELLDRLSGHPNQRGISWFFWDSEVFSAEWCARRLKITVTAAGERYTPELHLDLPIAFALDGLVGSKAFHARFLSLCHRAGKLARRTSARGNTGLGVTDELRGLARSVDEWRDAISDVQEPPERFPGRLLLNRTRAVVDQVGRTYPPDAEAGGDGTSAPGSANQRSALTHQLRRLEDALFDLESFLEAPASEAAESGALVMTGDAGQGKTHLLCDAGERAISAGRPAAVVLGNQLPGRDVWAGLATRLGLPNIGSEALVGGMQAAAEAAGEPFLLCIDALNESAEPEAWRDELPALLAEVRDNPWIAIALSVRSSFIPTVFPPGGLSEVAEIQHPGFRCRELEATEKFFDHFGLTQPRVPLLTPEFSNPLFLKLYCEGLKGLGLREPPDGEAHVTGVFRRYMEWKEERIVGHLKLDPALQPVNRAVGEFSGAMVAAGREQIPYEDAARMMTSLAPGKTEWPDTLLGQLLSEGILTAEMAWDWDTNDYRRFVRFSYQRFADHQAAQVMLGPYDSTAALKKATHAGGQLRKELASAPGGWIEAMTVQLPERFGIELHDLANWRLPNHRRQEWDRALIRSMVAREPAAITKRTRQLIGKAQARTDDLDDEVLEALISVAPHPSHPLNSHHLHTQLMPLSMPDRDIAWSMPTYHLFGNGGPLDRLIRWAARGAASDVPDDVIELASVAIAWTFTSPNRPLRDYATKALVRLLGDRLDVAVSLLEKFQGANDPYVVERVAVVAHGAVLTGGKRAPKSALAVAVKAKELLDSTDSEIPSINTRDAVRGIWEWCWRLRLVPEEDYGALVPPYGSEPPRKPRTKKQLEKAYKRRRKGRAGHPLRSEYSSLFHSLFDLGDFGRYVVGSKVRHFSRYPLDKPIPKARPRSLEKLRKKRWGEFTSLLRPEQLAALDSEEETLQMLEELDDKQQQAFSAFQFPRFPPDPKAEFSPETASCWIFERVLGLGWTPELFDEWERTYVREDPGRSGHKPERFGKKYQWIALRELLARLADGFHLAKSMHEERPVYQGPWQMHARDIDPTLPPLSPPLGQTRKGAPADTFARDPQAAWWNPPGPSFRADDPLMPDDWASQTDDIPSLHALVERIDAQGERWIVLQAYFNWDEEQDEDGDIRSPRRRDMWSHIKSWLVPTAKEDELVRFLRPRSLMNNWMPEGMGQTNGAYLGEMPWAESAQEYPDVWCQVDLRQEAPPVGLFVYPTWADYNWEGVTWDCSIDESVASMVPAPELFEATALEWRPSSREWCDPDGNVVAQYRQAAGERHSALVVKEKWLADLLRDASWTLVVGRLGEKQMFTGDFGPNLIGSWTEVNSVAAFDGGQWTFHPTRYEERFPAS